MSRDLFDQLIRRIAGREQAVSVRLPGPFEQDWSSGVADTTEELPATAAHRAAQPTAGAAPPLSPAGPDPGSRAYPVDADPDRAGSVAAADPGSTETPRSIAATRVTRHIYHHHDRQPPGPTTRSTSGAGDSPAMRGAEALPESGTPRDSRRPPPEAARDPQPTMPMPPTTARTLPPTPADAPQTAITERIAPTPLHDTRAPAPKGDRTLPTQPLLPAPGPEPPTQGSAAARPPPRPISIHIDSVEIHAGPTRVAPPRKPAATPRSPVLSLDDYLSGKAGG